MPSAGGLTGGSVATVEPATEAGTTGRPTTGGASGSGSTTAESESILAAAAADQTKLRDEAIAEKAAAESNKAAASETISALNELNFDSLAARVRRAASSAYPKPTECAGVKTLMQTVANILESNPSQALAIVNTLNSRLYV